MFWHRQKSFDPKDVAADPGRLELFCLLRREFDDALLQEMAGVDGGMCQEQCLKALAEILRTGKVVFPLPPHDPVEVCRIVGHHKLDLSMPLSPQERRRQIMRLFGAWILLNIYARAERYDNGQTEEGDELALHQLTEACVVLGPEFVRAGIRFVLWAQSAGAAAHDNVENLFYLLSLLVLRCASPDPEERAAAPAVYHTLVTEESNLRPQMPEQEPALGQPEPAWLFGVLGSPKAWEVRCIQRQWAETAVWVLDHLAASALGGLDPGLAEFKHCLLALLSR